MSGAGGGGRGGRGGGGGEGRLTKALVDTGKADSAGMNFRALHDPGLIMLTAGLNKDQSPDEVRKLLIDTLEGVIKNPPTKEETERVTTTLLRNLEKNLSDPQAIATGALNEAIAQGDWRLMFLQHDRLKDVGPLDVVRVAKAYLKASNRTVGYFIPDAAPDRTVVPPTPDLQSLLNNYKSSVLISHAEVFDPTPANIESRVLRFRLPNGMKVVILPKKTEAEMVTATIDLRFGDATSLAGKNTAAQLAGSLLNAGTKSKTREQVADEMRKLNARIQVSGGGGGGFGGRGGGGTTSGVSAANASITAPAANFIAALKLAVELLREPAYSQTEYDRARQPRIKALDSAPTEPTQLAAETLSRHLAPWQKGDVLYNSTREEQLAEMKQVTLDDVKKFHDQFYGANFGVLAVVGPVDQAALKTVATELLGAWNTAMPYQPIIPAFKAVPPMNQKIETPDKANARFEAGLRVKLSENDPDYPAMLLAGYMFGGPITSHISDRIRNREGLSYGANARLAVPVEGDSSLLSGTVSLNPVNGPKVEFSFRDELLKTVKDGFTAKEVAEPKKAWLDNRLVSRSQDAALLTLLAAHEQRNRTMQWDAQLEQRIAALTPEQITAAFRSLIDPAALTIVKAGDFKAAGVYQ
jgi:zinc protease